MFQSKALIVGVGLCFGIFAFVGVGIDAHAGDSVSSAQGEVNECNKKIEKIKAAITAGGLTPESEILLNEDLAREELRLEGLMERLKVVKAAEGDTGGGSKENIEGVLRGVSSEGTSVDQQQQSLEQQEFIRRQSEERTLDRHFQTGPGDSGGSGSSTHEHPGSGMSK